MKNNYTVRRKGRVFEVLTPNERLVSSHPSANYDNTGMALSGIAHTKLESEELIAKIIAQKADRKYK